MLSIVPTPIGNLGDITLRAIETLRTADRIAAEDTRHAQILLRKYEISTPVLSYHSHSSGAKTEALIDLLKDGKHIALISDAGTPGISDPGYLLISRAIEEGIPITSLPGPVAATVALTLSGFPMHQFVFLGFLPIKKGRQTLFASLREESRTVVFYESPHRILKTLTQMADVLGERPAAVCRELTKIHEEAVRGTLPELRAHFEANRPRGEFTVVLKGK